MLARLFTSWRSTNATSRTFVSVPTNILPLSSSSTKILPFNSNFKVFSFYWPDSFCPTASRSNSNFIHPAKMADEVALDLAELRHLHSIAKRPRVVSLVSSEIRRLEKLPMTSSSQTPTPLPVPAKVPSSPSLIYSALASFSWDQDNDKVKIYISLEGVDQEKLETEFKPMSIDVKIHDVQGKNYRFSIPKLHKEIVPEKCKVMVKPTRIVITLFKSSKGNWLDLQFKEDKLKPSVDKNKDPMAGIMDLMKNMYEEGDEEMKKTIAKAWTDARSGKAADPLKGL